ncbi:hypothetical protein V8C42DRAFT_351427 [Trichoderma barbatum]
MARGSFWTNSIGSCAPSRSHDIRLGDVIVSTPRDGIGGVFQYDFGKTIQNQTFQTTGFLNQPPTVTIGELLSKKTRLGKKYAQPDPNRDKLYRSDIVHPVNDEASCQNICGDDVKKLEATMRDRLATERGVLCFEMEVADLMNQFPCLVIRSICDYLDSHNNRECQRYAGITAAAHVKDLLL